MNDYLKRITNYFLIGVLAFIPIVVILQIVLFMRDIISSTFQLVYGYWDNYLITISIFILSFYLFVYVGYRLSIVGRSWIIALIDNVINRIPLLNSIYRVIKKVVNLFSGHEKKEPREVVFTEYPKDDVWVPAYVTNKVDDMYILFIPTSPNPTSGFTVIVHESKIIKSKMNIEEATSFIISVGVDFNHIDNLQILKPK
ncbi:conserved hypothetical protein [Bathymodiolus platifrons methanotrophic gill symbiont]|uniref:DUF502 domain-containing protein n=1 Tax=Bathymodiolus platifrons methanotrophic gill symbiont TaxID=113268 RepID=UPI000B410962|nr:DUF502 domain-containing protein [Bathymodiolus platifrons methanotrophic gill symbiont]MCK5869885.1 DUF502 domain-containing protein [Methyloprofundus sp.]TXK96049.1 DUF502 domain-containing protein [Methylococcaceae bacterium HT1]TXL15443.1 DUF502 domain-containing protein [Methylococcaceae bacterium HT4]TXL17882.1 DUF502 domain-containing protein [Methylococcaceae bacterium HT3]TXL20571.1 DUF502 domain-containing protein [Methylococcaceae bacterium HT5]TXL22447.1 DUF502 domain-containin